MKFTHFIWWDMRYLRYIIILFFCFSLYSSYASIHGIPAPFVKDANTSCGTNVRKLSQGFASGFGCWVSDHKGTAKFSKDANYHAGDGVDDNLFNGVYVPHGGKYGIREYFCPVSVSTQCDPHNSFGFNIGSRMVNLNPLYDISSQNPDFGGNEASLELLGQPFGICVALYDENGNLYSNNRFGGIYCDIGSSALPDKPTQCTINNSNSLSVNLGTLDRKKIDVIPSVNGTGIKKNSVSVTCYGNSSINTKIKFKYNSKNVNGYSLVSTNLEGLGISLSLDNKIVSSLDTISKKFSSGTSTVTLGFQAVKAKDSIISTGAFNASVVMMVDVQ